MTEETKNEIITPDFLLFNAINKNNNMPLLIIAMKDIDYEEQLDILSYLRKKEYILKIEENILLLKFENFTFVFDFNEKNIDLPEKGITLVFDFIQEDGKINEGVKTLIEVVE